MKTPFGIGVAFAALSLLGLAGCGSEEPVSEADKGIFLRAADLARYGFQYENANSYETFSKARQLDGTYKLTYRFRTPPGERPPLHIYANVAVAHSESDAALLENAEKAGVMIGFTGSGLEEREVPMQPGDEGSRLRVLLKGGKPVGNVFTVRDGRKTYLLMLVGVSFQDARDWKRVIEPKLQRFAGYSPV